MKRIKKYTRNSDVDSLDVKLNSYSSLAKSYKTKPKKGLSSIVKKGALAALVPIAASAMIPNTVDAQCAASAGGFLFMDIDGDGVAEFMIRTLDQGTDGNWEILAVQAVGNAFYNATNMTGYVGEAGGLVCGTIIPWQAAGTLVYAGTDCAAGQQAMGFIYSVYGGVGYGNCTPAGGTCTVNLTLPDGTSAFIELAVTDVNTVDLVSINGTAPVACASLPLPVELMKFDAQANDKDITLAWETASEFNNAGFEIQRSADGQHFRKIGWADGQNNATETSKYAFSDDGILANVQYYYRLKQVNNDGSFEYSEITSAIIKDGKITTVSDFFPNPVVNSTALQINTNNDGTATISVFNNSGQLVQSRIVDVTAGNNSVDLDLSQVANGSYFAKIELGNDTFYKKLNVTK